jgi:two-component system chemotaxis sensor kinase CheA
MVDILLQDAKKVLMMPFSSILEVLPKMVRDISRAQEKTVELVVQGTEVEIDKRILEEMKDPLIHLLRNCIDHGVEPPVVREEEHKSPRGVISIAITPGDGNFVDVVVSDDGAGIDAEKVKNAAVQCGILTRQAADKLLEQDAIALIFQSDVSTSPVVSDLSGRGLGMAIVREKVEKLGGQITIETKRHQGTTFRIRLPLTLATFRGILVEVAEQAFVVPTANVERVVRVKRDEIHTVGGRETLSLAGQTVTLLGLDQVLGIPQKTRGERNSRFLPALILGGAEQRFAFIVDAVLNEQEVMFKSLGKQLSKVRNIAGATVLGSGQVVPVLNVADLIVSTGGSVQVVAKAAQEVKDSTPVKKSILIAEDSITSRMLLKEILEGAGYTVSTAIDGEDAFATLQKTRIDLVVSDVEMPRLNGFDLTVKIRAHEQHTHVPVVLVTGLESQEDRERGIDAGANAYVVKGSFDQSNLLETIRRLI